MDSLENNHENLLKKKEKDPQLETRQELINFASQKTKRIIKKIEDKILKYSTETPQEDFLKELNDEILNTINFIQRTKVGSTFSEKKEEHDEEGGVEKKTEEDKNEKEIENSQKIILSIFRHDIGNKLSTLYSGINLLGLEGCDQEFIFEEMKRQVNQIKNLLKGVEDLTESISSGEFMLQNIKKIAQRIQEDHDDLNVEIEKDYYGQSYVKTHFSFYSMLDNIVANAIRHGQATEIKIKIKKEDDEFILLEIENNGTKLKKGIEEKIFKKGFKDKKTGNTGLGLTLVKEHIEDGGGKIWAENTEKGVNFIIKFPLLEEI